MAKLTLPAAPLTGIFFRFDKLQGSIEMLRHMPYFDPLAKPRSPADRDLFPVRQATGNALAQHFNQQENKKQAE